MPEILKHIKNPKIKDIFKNFGAQPRSINNLPGVYWSHHFKILNDLEYFAEPTICKQLSRSMLYKIKTVPWAPEMSLINDGLQKLKTQHIDFTKQRNIDVFFAGRTLYNIPGSEVQQIFQHQKKAIEAIANIKDIKSVIIENSIVTHDKYVEQLIRRI